MSVQALSWVFSLGPDVGGTDRLVLLSLANHADDLGECWPGVARIAGEAGVSERTVRRSIQNLVEAGVLEVERQGSGARAAGRADRATNLYRLRSRGANVSPRTGHGVTRVTERGDTRDRHGVTRVSPESSLNRQRTARDEPSNVYGREDEHHARSQSRALHLAGECEPDCAWCTPPPSIQVGIEASAR